MRIPKVDEGKSQKHYKIRHVPTGQFSTGGMNPRRSSRGKVWKHQGHVLNHLGLCGNPDWYKDCVVEEYELVVVKASERPLAELIQVKKDNDAAREREIQERSNAEKEARERAELERLQKKYGS